MKNFDWSSFLSNILSVVLGIFITFWIQGMIDRKAERADVRSALELVKEELLENKSSLEDAIGIIAMEREAAESLRGSEGLTDTMNTRNTVLYSEYFFTVTDDALELLKSSSLFQKMNDNALALSIIKAYDYLSVNSQAFNTHEKYKTDLFKDRPKDSDFILKSVIEMSDDAFLRAGIPEIDGTIDCIDRRLKK